MYSLSSPQRSMFAFTMCKQKARRHTNTPTQAGQTGLEMLSDKRFRAYQQDAFV